MARAVEFSQIDIREKDDSGDVETLKASEVADRLASTLTPNHFSVSSGSPLGGEASQRAKVLEYLNSPTSKGKLSAGARKELRMWAEGASQNEVERKLGVHQGTLSRKIKAALAAAYKGR